MALFLRLPGMKTKIAEVMTRQGGVISRRQDPELAESLSWLVRRGELASVLPGVYSRPETVGLFETRVRAARLWDPDAVLVGAAAAKVSFWPEMRVTAVALAAPSQRRMRSRAFTLERRRIPADLILEHRGLRYSSPALTALDLCPTRGGDGIDSALRTRATTLTELWAAFEATRGRRDNLTRTRLLVESRDEPWSFAERRTHVVLHRAGIEGWVANHPVLVAGTLYYIDVAFEENKLALEIDGRFHEDDHDQFESDRWRQNALALQGWTVLRFTWPMVRDHPQALVNTVRAALRPEKLTLDRRGGAVSRSA